MRRMTRHDYRQAASFERCEEAALAYADADTDDDVAFHRAKARLRAAIKAREVAAVKADREQRRRKTRSAAMAYPCLPF